MNAGAGLDTINANATGHATPRRRVRWGERTVEWTLAACGYASVAVLGGIFALLLWQGAKAFQEVPLWEFLTTARWDPTSPERAGYGILAMVASTGLVSADLATPVATASRLCLARGDRDRAERAARFAERQYTDAGSTELAAATQEEFAELLA